MSAEAEIQLCRMIVADGSRKLIMFDPAQVPASSTYRESALSWSSDAWSYIAGKEPQCRSPVMISYLRQSSQFGAEQPVCLIQNGAGGWELALGEPNFQGSCMVPVCNRVNDAEEAVGAAVLSLSSAVWGGATVASVASVQAVTHSSGALILTGSSGYIAGTLGTAGTVLVGVVTSPYVLLGTGLVAGTGAVAAAYCED